VALLAWPRVQSAIVEEMGTEDGVEDLQGALGK
jgi:hypothetical protein